MNKDFDFSNDKRNNHFQHKKKHKKFISEETHDQNKIKKGFKNKQNQIKADELWEDWEDNEVY